ncbi:Cro/CI family transcriptional regulator [Enterobacter sichuanensis]|uniref:Cro/CI family transcriptional regulator n=1 Tax=Enterobacter sichuanensis TaxID=2071710 RepID=UPI000CED95AA|nr:Cro/CI family transcriptional regulator [Enterobacter sichuanensis]
MKTETVISFFGTKTAVARALGISQVAVTRWGSVVPEKRAARLSLMTNGELIYDPKDYQNPVKSANAA